MELITGLWYEHCLKMYGPFTNADVTTSVYPFVSPVIIKHCN